MSTTRNYYAFAYRDGTGTTTGCDKDGLPTHIAGRLIKFASAADRDQWVKKGYDCPVPQDMGEFRRSVKVDSLPYGWRTKMADEYDELV